MGGADGAATICCRIPSASCGSEKSFDRHKTDLLFSGEYDNRSAIIAFPLELGWTHEILRTSRSRHLLRWAEKSDEG